MINSRIVLHQYGSFLRQSSCVLVYVGEIVVLGFISFAIDFDTHPDGSSTILVLSSPVASTEIFVRFVLPSFLRILLSCIIAGLCIGCCAFFSEFPRDPLSRILVSMGIGRIELLLSTFLAVLFAFSTNFAVFGGLGSLALTIKMGDTQISWVIMSLCLLLVVEAFCIAAWVMLMAMLVPSQAGVVSLCLGAYFILGPLLLEAEGSIRGVLRFAAMLLPPFGLMSTQIVNAMSHLPTESVPFLRGTIVSFVYLACAMVLFNRRDLL